MKILARVNVYYGPFIPHTIMEEEDKADIGDVFSLAEEPYIPKLMKKASRLP